MPYVNLVENIGFGKAATHTLDIPITAKLDINKLGKIQFPLKHPKVFLKSQVCDDNLENEFFSGYNESPDDYLSKTFEDVQGYEDIVMLKDISFHSHCEHHMVPIIGKVHLAYIPTKKVVGISKLARVVDIFAKRLQTQETMTQQIASCIEKSLKPKGVAVYIEALHQCMTTRGVLKPNVSTITSCFLGEFKSDKSIGQRFTDFIK